MTEPTDSEIIRMHPERKQKRKDYMSMSPNQLKRKIFQMQTFIEGQFAGGHYDSQDMYDADLGHLATLVDMIDAHNANSPDNKMDYPKIRDETMRPVQYGSYQVVQEKVVKSTKKQLRQIIKEERAKISEGVPSAMGMQIFAIKDELFDIKLRVARHDEELANELGLQIDRLLRLGHKA